MMKRTKPTFVLCLILLAQMVSAQQKLTFQRSTSFTCGANVLYTGAVKNGKANGYGKAYVSYDKITDTLSPHIWIYEGYWKDNDFNGKGNLRKNYSGGDWYRGNFSNGQLHGQGETYSYYGGGIKKGIFVQGEYKGNPAGQKTLDSLLLIYKPLLKITITAENAAQKLGREILEVPQDIAKKSYIDLINEFLSNNMQAAYHLIIQAPYYFKYEELLALLSPSQKDELRKVSQKIIDDYNKKSNTSVAATPTTTTTAAKPKTKQEEIDLFLNEKGLKKNKTYVFKPEWSGDAMYYLLTYIDYEKNEIRFVNMSMPDYERTNGAGVIKLNIIDYFGKISLSETPLLAKKQYYNCKVCNATGQEDWVETKTREKELPQGYFDGIKTTSTRTTTTIRKVPCRTCHGLKMILK